jgi:hypothetical protein
MVRNYWGTEFNDDAESAARAICLRPPEDLSGVFRK